MHVYCFYTNTINGLEPRLYAFTHKKNVASEFAETRKGLREIIKDIDKATYNTMRDKLDGMYIIKDELVSKSTSGNKVKVKVYATTNEIMKFRSHADAIATMQLGSISMDTRIFEDDVRDALNELGMQGCYDAYFGYSDIINPLSGNLEEVVQPRLWSGEYCLDEFEIFVKHWYDTFFDTTKDRRN